MKRTKRIGLLVAAATLAMSAAAAPAQAGWVAGNGFNSSGTGLLPSGYTVRLVDSPGIELLRPEFEAAVAEIVAITGLPVTVAPGVIGARTAATGEFLAQVSLECQFANKLAAGCAISQSGPGPKAGVEYQLSSQIHVAPHELFWGDAYHVVRHELGHALGLEHYRLVFEGNHQIMNDVQHSARTYQSGDRNGLIYGRDLGAL